MSQYKSAIRAQPPQEQHPNSKYSAQARQLQELFPLWKNDDLQSLLVEVGGDVELAATRISDGKAEQWGEVSHKKDKKAPASIHAPKPSFSARGDSRGGRGGRSGRSGAGRGGATTRGRSATPRGSANGHVPHADGIRSPVPNAVTTGSMDASGGDACVKPPLTEPHDQHGGLTGSISTSTDASSQPETSTLATSISANGSAWGATDIFPAEVSGTAPVTNMPVSKSKTPATSKLSWAQIARHCEKSAIPQTLPPPPVHVLQPAPECESQPEVQQHGREEPTTAEAPTWDDEPATSQVNGSEAWPLVVESVLEPPKPESPTSVIVEVQSETVDESVPEAESILESEPEIETRSPVQVMQVTSALPTQVAATPSPKLTTRPPVASHRTNARYKVTDQPVTMPVSFSTGIEKVGMQFGSLSLGGDGPNESTSNEHEVSAPASEPASPPTLQAKTQPEPAAAPPATAPAASNSLASVFQQQQSAPPQTPTQPHVPPQTSIPHHSIPTSISQPIQSTQTSSSHAVAATSPLQQFAQQQALANNSTHQHQPQIAQHQQHQQPPHLQHLPQQVQQSHGTHHSYAQLGLPTHIDPSQQTQPPAPQQALQSGPHSNYFRQTETMSNPPYFHTPTPPAAQSQESPYGSFSQLGTQGQHQPSSHHSSFGGSDYGYTENQRGFYESYAQQVGFGTRNPTVMDDGKSISIGQQPTTSTLPSSNVQTSQQHSSQTGGQPQQSGGQGPQQAYPPPMPYYFPHAYSQNQYYGTPYSSGYVPQPFVKYPAMFQPGPPGPGSANSPAAKQPGGNVGVQPQTNPYNQALYQQGGYDDYQPHPHHSQHQHQHSHSLGLTQGAIGVSSGEYGKQLYGGVAQSGMQGFMGLGGQTGSGGTGPTSNTGPRGTSSPETAYKPYTAKDVGATAGRGAPVQQGGQGQGQPQSQGQGQGGQGGPQGQSFYGNRFGNGVGGSGTGGVVGGPQAGGHHQQGGPQGHLGYPQSGSEPNFYGYQPRQQQGYWQ